MTPRFSIPSDGGETTKDEQRRRRRVIRYWSFVFGRPSLLSFKRHNAVFDLCAHQHAQDASGRAFADALVQLFWRHWLVAVCQEYAKERVGEGSGRCDKIRLVSAVIHQALPQRVHAFHFTGLWVHAIYQVRRVWCGVEGATRVAQGRVHFRAQIAPVLCEPGYVNMKQGLGIGTKNRRHKVSIQDSVFRGLATRVIEDEIAAADRGQGVAFGQGVQHGARSSAAHQIHRAVQRFGVDASRAAQLGQFGKDFF